MIRRDAMPPIRTGFRVLLLTMLALTAAGCGGFSGFELPGSGGAAAPPLARPSPPPVNMAGRWMLASPGRGQCSMTFGAAAPGAAEGTIAPEGGCPGKFFTSRKWGFDSNGLTIRDHNSEPLAQLSAAGGVRFDGKATTGDPVTLTR
jgi:protease inhibitor Inh